MRRMPRGLAGFALIGSLIALPAPSAADTVYYANGGKGIASVTGTIQREDGSSVDVVTADGRTVSIAKGDVYQIVRDAPPPKRPAATPAPAPPPAAATKAPVTAAAPTAAPAPPAQPAPAAAPAAAASDVTGTAVATPEPTAATSPGDVPAADPLPVAATPTPDPATATPPPATSPTATPPAASASAPSLDDARLEALFAAHAPDRKPDVLPGSPRPAPNRHYGVKGGMNSANLSADPASLEDHDSLTSYAFGAWYGIPLTRRVTVQTEALYSVKGDAETSEGYTTSTRVSYLDVPVLAKLGFLHGAPVQPALFVGPSLAVNVAAKSKLEGESTSLDVDIKDEVRNFDLGLVLGGGVDFSVGAHTCGIELRYSKGLSNAAGDNANGTAHNNVLAILGSVGLQ